MQNYFINFEIEGTNKDHYELLNNYTVVLGQSAGEGTPTLKVYTY